MLIRSTPHACFVILRNGLTLELFYDETFTGTRADGTRSGSGTRAARPEPSQGVWLMGESVLLDVRAGQA